MSGAVVVADEEAGVCQDSSKVQQFLGEKQGVRGVGVLCHLLGVGEFMVSVGDEDLKLVGLCQVIGEVCKPMRRPAFVTFARDGRKDGEWLLGIYFEGVELLVSRLPMVGGQGDF